MLAFVGKPSAGKSSFLNSVTNSKAKVGAYPFTTIDPNHGTAVFPTPCPCGDEGWEGGLCTPRSGVCTHGTHPPHTRYIPIPVLDVAGLVPGAAEGEGLGNKFLDDLRQAKILVHVVDVSGTTDERGKEARGYDPQADVAWLIDELVSWVAGNLEAKWGNTAKRHARTRGRIVDTLQAQLSGYGTKPALTARLVAALGFHDSVDLAAMEPEDIRNIAATFVDLRFPIIYALNKIDHPDADLNILNVVQACGEDRAVLCSAKAEIALKKWAAKGYITYTPGSDTVEKSPSFPEKYAASLESIEDLVLYRHGGTGVHDVIQMAVSQLGLFPVYPIASFSSARAIDAPSTSTASSSSSSSTPGGCFPDVVMVAPGTTARSLAIKHIHALFGPEDPPELIAIEKSNGMVLGGGHVLTPEDRIFRIVI